jgi:hypothetical protein
VIFCAPETVGRDMSMKDWWMRGLILVHWKKRPTALFQTTASAAPAKGATFAGCLAAGRTIRGKSDGLLLGALILIVSACATPTPYERPEPHPTPPEAGAPPVETQPGSPPTTVGEPQPLPGPVSREPVLGAASRALVEHSRIQVASKNYAVAAGSIERALRIEPANPLLWIELAKIRQAEGNYVQAENMARKAISTSTQAPRAQATAWQLIAETYRARDRNLEAREAEAKADSLLRR